MKKKNWLEKFPNYKNYLFKISLPLYLIAGIIHYLLMIRFNFDNISQPKEIYGSIFFAIFMIITDYFTFYRPNRKFHLNKK
ncbi:hypothetical protein Belba_1131 [Belliella baltica DSM 15883]|uniref:Uncharacterized protein n=1 Tax=Belliella baltica (strain DSM 15883 / CIP 108006 / LMG 21964 / BA134) TaxID=866536 RepID=I3Z3E9_BELBD|nr:hypothetical protein Belba_1131 [Belliella baltica DSM 15883]